MRLFASEKLLLCSEKYCLPDVEDMGRVLQCSFDIMRNHKDRHVIFIEFPEKFIHFICGFRIQAGYRFIQKQYPVRSTECPGQQHSLLLTSGQFSVTSLRESFHAHAFQVFFCQLFLGMIVKRPPATAGLTS